MIFVRPGESGCAAYVTPRRKSGVTPPPKVSTEGVEKHPQCSGEDRRFRLRCALTTAQQRGGTCRREQGMIVSNLPKPKLPKSSIVILIELPLISEI